MRRLSPLLLLVAVAAGCGAATTTPDLALIPIGCRAPGFCFIAASACGCNRADVQSGGACLVCDPTQMPTGAQQCDCNADGGIIVDNDLGTASGQVCIEPGQLCVGRGPVCPGEGARCLPAGTVPDGGACPSTGGDPPTLVGVDTGDSGVIESQPRCAYADDTCCPGSVVDMAVPDLSEPPDLLGVTD
jgi:hypothetical protein